MDGLVGIFSVPGVKNSGKSLIEMFNDLGLLIGKTCYKKRMIHKYTRERVVKGGIADRAVMDYVMISKDMRGRLLDVNV